MSLAEPANDLGVVQETLLIPLAARAAASRLHPGLKFEDPLAEAIVARLDADTDRFLSDRASMIGSVLRAKWFDHMAREFIRTNPAGLCVSLGAGLDARAHRIGASHAPELDWVDVDLPDVARLRDRLIPAAPRVRTLAGDLREPAWLETIGWTAGRPLLVMAEGVLMYLEEAEVFDLFGRLCGAAQARSARLDMVFDYASPTMARIGRRHPSVRKTKADFRWGLKRPSDLLALDPALRVAAHTDIMGRSGFGPWVAAQTYRLLTAGRRFYGLAHLRREG